MRNILIFLILMAVAPSNVYSDTPDKTLHNQCIYPTVEIIGEDECGSGFIIRSDKISDDEYHNIAISCAHCFSSGKSYQIGIPVFKDWSTLEKYELHKAFVYMVDREKDVAVVLFSTNKPVQVAKVNYDVKLYIGSDVIRVGCGLGDEHRVDYGKVTSVKTSIPHSNIKDVLRTSIFTVPGDSGGPVFHNYEVVGIMQAIRGSGHPIYGISYCIPVSRLKTWSQELNNTLDFLSKSEEKAPYIPYFFMEWGESNTGEEMMPANHWAEGF